MASAEAFKESGIDLRELQVVELMAEGLTNERIAARLGHGWNREIVANVSRTLYRKVGIADRAGAVAWCIRKGIID